MRSGVICVLLVFIIRREGSGAAEDEFRPTPIPLNEWREVRGWREQRAGTLHEAGTTPPPTRYWEDALRHSVYLALVRDKIDQLIAKGDFIDHPADDLDDRDLWDKVKRAPYERTEDEDPAPLGDVALMAKGRLMEEHAGYRFMEDDKFGDKCADDKCMDGVKALWAVKRVRQRDSETTGRYHYELTFSVITQKKHKKPSEKPARTFTVRETGPEKIVETPQESRYYEPAPVPVPVPVAVQPPRTGGRAIWFHKNIAPAANQARQHHNGLDRLFSSLFSDDDEDDLPPPRYKPKQYFPPPPVYQQYSKAGYVGAPSEQQHKKITPHGHKPHHVYKYNHYSRPIPPPPPYHHYLDIEQIGVVSNPYQDHRYGPPNKPGKTQRPPVLPTPPNPVLPQKNFTIETTTQLKPNQSDETTPKPETVYPPKTYNKQRPTTMKISYVTDHVRPPVYNAPPGVFVTMDKKPFKPMPPLRLVHSSKLHKTPRPTDFRPSPQVLDIQFSEPDPLFDTAFRPITVNYANSNTTEKAVSASDNYFRKSNATTKKPPKKNEIVNAQRVTTIAPEIITAHSVEADSDAEWTNVLGAFAKTTPMAAEKEKAKTTETTTPMTTSTVSTTTTTTPAPTTTIRKRTTTTTEAPTTTPKPKKRTRPPPKFTKPEKVKKHKRVMTTTTEAPHKRNKDQDLTPQASSAAAAFTAKLTSSTTTSTTTSTTSTTTTTPQPRTTPQPTTPQPTTTPVQTTTTTQATTTTTEAPSTTERETAMKRKNRYRQSTLKYRSTGIASSTEKKDEKTRTVLPPTGKFPPRRKGSKYQNYLTSTPKFSDMQFDELGREHHVVSPYKSKSISTTESTTRAVSSTTPAYEEVADHVYITSESPEYSMSHEDDFDEDSDETEDEQESRQTSEFLPSTSALVTPSETINEIVEIEDEPLEITAEVVTTTVAPAKNKTKCKKKNLPTLANTTEETKSETAELEVAASEIVTNIDNSSNTQPSTTPTTSTISSTTTTTTEQTTTPDIFQEIFGGFTFDDSAESNNNETLNAELEEQETTNQDEFIKSDEDFADFFQAFDDKHRQEHRDGKFDDEYEYDDKESFLDDDEFPGEEDRRSSRNTQHQEETYDDYQERPYSLLELMAME